MLVEEVPRRSGQSRFWPASGRHKNARARHCRREHTVTARTWGLGETARRIQAHRRRRVVRLGQEAMRSRRTTTRMSGDERMRERTRRGRMMPNPCGDGFTACRRRQYRKHMPAPTFPSGRGVVRACKLGSRIGPTALEEPSYGDPDQCLKSTWITASSGTKKGRRHCR